MIKYGFFHALFVVLSIVAIHYFLRRAIRKSKLQREKIMQSGDNVSIAILSLKQSGLYVNNNPVLDLTLKVSRKDNAESWLVESFKETAYQLALKEYDAGAIYKGKLDSSSKGIYFVKDESGRPMKIS